MIRKTSVMLLILGAAALGACSDASSNSQNTVSPYDREFDKDAEEAALETDLTEADLLERAKSAYDRGLYSVARENWTTLREQYPSSYYATLSELKIGDTYYFAGDYPAAVTAYEEFLKLHPAHDATPYVRYQIGNAYREQYSGVRHDQAPLNSAMKNYKKLLEDYPRSEFAVSARRAIADCRELLAEHEASIARFYEKQGYGRAQEKRLEELVAAYPETRASDWARERLAALEADGLRQTKKRKPQPNEAAPGKPALIVAGEMVEDDASEARFRMSKQSEISEENISLERKTEKPEKDAFSPLLFVSCSEQDGMAIFSANFREPMKVGIPKSSAARSALLRTRNAPRISSVQKSETLKSCSADGVELTLSSAAEDDQTVIAEIDGAGKREAHFFSLDRPNRLVVVVEN